MEIVSQYKLSLLDSDTDKKTIIEQIINDPSLTNLQTIIQNHSAAFLDNEMGIEFIQSLKETSKKYQAYLRWEKIKCAYRAGHFFENRIEKYQMAQNLGINMPPRVPCQSIKPNLKAFQDYRSSLKPEYHAHANAMMGHLNKISFQQLKILLKNLADKLNQHIFSQQYDKVYLFYRGEKKSEYWILKLIFPFLNFNVADIIEVSNDYEFVDEKNQNTILKLTEAVNTPKSCLMLIDDGSYSGAQCSDHVMHLLYRLAHIHQTLPTDAFKGSLELVFAFTYTTNHALKNMSNILEILTLHRDKLPIKINQDLHNLIQKIYLFSEKTILTVKETNWDELSADYASIITRLVRGDKADEDTLTLVYTDWRTPDGLSSSQLFFKAQPPISFCPTEIHATLEVKQNQLIKDDERIIPENLMCPYK